MLVIAAYAQTLWRRDVEPRHVAAGNSFTLYRDALRLLRRHILHEV